MSPAFGVSAYWYRQEFATSTGMVHWQIFFSVGKAAEPSGGGQFFFLGFPVSSFPAGWEALRPNCSVAHWDNTLPLLTNRFNIHRCSDYCLIKSKTSKEKACRMEFGTKSSPGKEIRETPALVKDKNGSLRLEMSRDHPSLIMRFPIRSPAKAMPMYMPMYHTRGRSKFLPIPIC
jgi:hypothetical protein